MAAPMSPAARALALRSAGLQAHYAPPAPKRTPAPPGGKKPIPPKPTHISQTAAQVANNQVTAALQPQITATNQQYGAQRAAIQGFAQALLGKVAQLPGQIGGDYDQAIGQQTALAGAAANALRSANPNQQDQQLLAALNAPQSQQDAVANQLANTFGGGAGVVLTNQGLVPVTQLAGDKAAAQTQARSLVGSDAMQGLADLRASNYNQNQDLAKIEAQRPALFQTALQNIRQNQAGRAAQAFKQVQYWTSRADALKLAGDKLGSQQAIAQARIAEQRWAQTQQTGRTRYQQQQENARSQAGIASREGIAAANRRAAAARAATGVGGKAPTVKHWSDGTERQWNPSTGNWDIVGQAKPSAASRTRDKQDFPNLSGTQLQHLRSGVANGYYGVPKHKNPAGKQFNAVPAQTYQDAIDEGVKAGYSRAAATKMANRFYTQPWQRTGGWTYGMPGPKP